MTSPVLLRPFEAGDMAFVRAAWVRGAAKIAEEMGGNTPHGYRRVRNRVERVMQHPTTRIVMAANAEAPTHLFGFVAYAGPNVIHWIYVTKEFRGYGIGKEMLAAALPKFGSEVTVATSRCLKWPARSAKYRV